MSWRRRLRQAAGIAALSWGLAALVLEVAIRLTPPPSPPGFSVPPGPPSAPGVTIPDRLGRGDTLSDALRRNGLSTSDTHALSQALAPHLNLRALRPGDEISLYYDFQPRASLVRIELVGLNGLNGLKGLIGPGAFQIFRAVRSGDDWRAEKIGAPLSRREVARQGSIRGNLYASMTDAGEEALLAIAFADLFAWDFDFHIESREGDRFAFLVEKLYRSEESEEDFLGYGKLLGALYRPQDADASHLAFFFEDPSGHQGYYDWEGRSVRKAFLKSPLEFRRVSSRFSYARLHPILGRSLPHLGVDYAAPPGTPVHAVADGVVADVSRSGGSGKQVTLRHGLGYQSRYLHLSRFAADLRVGARVSQKQVIGYVGASGLATGPHLDFRLTRHGRPVNPLKEIFPPGPPVPEESREVFRRQVEQVLSRMETAGAPPLYRGAGR